MTRYLKTSLVGLFVLFSVVAVVPDSSTTRPAGTALFIVQSGDLERTRREAEALGATVTHELGIIRALGIRMTREQLGKLRLAEPTLRFYEEGAVEVAGSKVPYTDYPRLLGSEELHTRGIDGMGVSVAVLDTGIWRHRGLKKNASGRSRILALYDAIQDRPGKADDENGHGTHVASILLDSMTSTEDGEPIANGVAPGTDLVVVKAFGRDGWGTYADVVRGLDWIVAHKEVYGIRVLNLSFSAAPRSHYWDDPINQAVMRAWQAGIFVVSSAGNLGPEPMTIGVPGNVPYVMTVGAISDAYTPQDRSDDFIATFSAAGPTYEAFVKPEVLAPGGHMRGLMNKHAYIAAEHPDLHDTSDYFTMSGTSQAAAAVSGVAALLLQQEPWLTPDQVKCRLMASTLAALDGAGGLAYSPFRHGAGLVHAGRALAGTLTECANLGLDVDKDLAGLRALSRPRARRRGRCLLRRGGPDMNGTARAPAAA